MKIRVDCRTEGPLESGEAEKAAEDWVRNTTQALGDKAVEMLGSVPMDKSGRSTGAFRANLHVKRISVSTVRVPGPQVRGVTWAPWLEGKSQRNSSTGFKGYGLFRKTRLALSREAEQVGQEELTKVLPRMGGGA